MSWSIDGKDLSNLAWNVKNRSAGWSVPGRSGENIRVPGRHGSFWVPDKTYEEGRLSLSMWAVGCNEDGTLPLIEDGRRKVRDNLDRLTSMFSTTKRLLTLRQTTGSGTIMVNELGNPTFSTNSNAGIDIAIDGLKDGSLGDTKSREISRDVFTNPYLKARDTNNVILTEDIYPDPTFREHLSDPSSNLLRSYYYPIKQDWSGFNPFFNAANGFSWSTGVGGRGLINIAKTVNFPGRAWIGEIIRLTNSSQTDKCSLYMNLRLGSNSNSNSVPIKITSSVSEDGVNWTVGAQSSFTITNTFQSIFVPASDLPVMPAGSSFQVRYAIEVSAASGWTKDGGSAFEVTRVAIQDSYRAGNPWVGNEIASHYIVGGETNYTKYLGANGKSWSVFNRINTPEWVPVITSDRSFTSPYAFAWNHYDAGKKEAWQAFTVFGGLRNTFRRDLPSPTYNTQKVRIWGRCWVPNPNASIIRLMRLVGATWTEVASTSVSGSGFASPTFDLVAGGSYRLEVVVPVSDSGMEPSLVLRELHVSNGIARTTLPVGSKSHTWGASSAYYAGPMYKSAIIGKSYKVPSLVKGVPRDDSKEQSSIKGTGWASQLGSARSENGEIITEKMVFPSTLEAKRLNFRANMYLHAPTWSAGASSIPASLSVPLSLTLYNSAGAVTRTVTQNLTNVTNQRKDFTYAMNLNAGEVAVSAKLTVDNTTHPLLGIVLERLQLMVNLPNGVDNFTGSEVNVSDQKWPQISAWSGEPYFSQSILTAAMSSSWDFEDFVGFDSMGASCFTGTKIRVKANLTSGSSYIGFRRGSFVANQTVTAQPEGAATPTSLGTVTSGTANVQAKVTVPAGGSTYVDFVVTGSGAYKTVKDAYALDSWQPVFPVPSTDWLGFSETTPPSLGLPSHPSSVSPQYTVVRRADGTSVLSTGSVKDWSGSILGGGYLQVPVGGTTLNNYSNTLLVSGGYASAALRVQPTPEAVGRFTLEILGATAAEFSAGTWTTLGSKTLTTVTYQELKLVDVAVGAKKYLRLNLKSTNTDSAVTRGGILAIMDGATLTTSSTPLGSTFPGYFVGVKGPDGSSSYLGNVRQIQVEVVEAIDMQSTGLGTIAEFNVNLVAPTPFWEDIYDVTSTLTAPAGAKSGSFYLADFGGATAPMMDLTIDVQPVSGTLTEFKIVDKASGGTIKYKGPAQTKVSISNPMFTVNGPTGQSLIQYVSETGAAGLLPVTPFWRGEFESLGNHVDGHPVLEWTANTPIKLTVSGRRKYLIG